MLVVVPAGWLLVAEGSLEKSRHEPLEGRVRAGGMHGDPVLREQIEGPAPHATRDDDLHASLLEPARQQPGLVRRRNDKGLTGDFPGDPVDLDEGELLAMSEMGTQATGGEWNGDLHGWIQVWERRPFDRG